MDKRNNRIQGDNDKSSSCPLSQEYSFCRMPGGSRRELPSCEVVQNPETVNRIAGIAYGEYDADTGALCWHHAAPHLPGLHDHRIPRSFSECLNHYTQPDSEVLQEALERTISNCEQTEAEVHCIPSPGTHIRHRYTFIPLQQYNFPASKALCLVRDITDTCAVSSGKNMYPENHFLLSQDNCFIIFRISFPDGTCEYINQAVETITGYPPHLWYRNPQLLKQIIHPAWQTKFIREYKKFLLSHVREEYTFPIRRHCGDIRWIQLRTASIRNEQQELLAVEGIALDITEKKREDMERKALIRQLQKALNKVKTLSGLLPICSYCKKVRDDKGYWKQIESYISEHSELFFTHGLCPDCLAHHYPQYTHSCQQTKKISNV